MTSDQNSLPANRDTSDMREAEAKRIEARRRFLTRGAAGGSGLLIITFVHQRSFAQALPLQNGFGAPPANSTPLGVPNASQSLAATPLGSDINGQLPPVDRSTRTLFDPHPLPVTTVRGGFDPHPVPVTPRDPPGSILVSSSLMCTSLHGTAMGTQTVLDSVSGQLVTRVLCVRQ